MADIGAVLTKQAGPLPLGVWLVLGGAGAYVAVRSSRAKTAAATTTTTVEQVAVPVGAVGSQDQAPMVISPVVRINVPEIDTLTGAIFENTDANYGNALALGGNTLALGGSTAAIDAATSALGLNTATVGANTSSSAANTLALGGNTAGVNGLTTAILTAAKSVPVVTAPAPAPAPAAAPAARTYTIRSGDTLSAIAQRYTGSAGRWPELFNANAGTINSVAASRGKAGGGHWIFPGTVLTIPW